MPAVLKHPYVFSVMLVVAVAAFVAISMMLDADQPQRLDNERRQEQQNRTHHLDSYQQCTLITCP